MADDALRAATPVLRVVHAAAIKVLEENGVDTEKFGTRSHVPQRRGPGPDAEEGRRVRRVSRPGPGGPGPLRAHAGTSAQPAGQASASIFRVSASSCGSTLV